MVPAHRVGWILSLVLLLALALGACSPAATQASTATLAPAATQVPAATTPPTTAPTKAAEPTTTTAAAGDHLILATTTSTQDSGLLDYLLPLWEQETGIKVDVIAVGTGQALQMGKDGNADVLLVHARAQEDQFMAAGDGVRREDVMYNDFVVVGPEADPAGIKGLTSATEAFGKIAAAKATFVSRGDKSGTNTKELAIWKAAGIEPAGDWYVSAGQGMGEVLTMSDEQQAYTLSDRATYLARTKTGLKLNVLVEGDKILLNPYGVIAVNPAKSPAIHADLANRFIDWIISVPVQEKIAAFGRDDFGQSLFVPDSAPWHAAHPAAEATGTPAADAATLIFTADTGETAEAKLADVLACKECLLSFRNRGGFSLVMPGFAQGVQLRGVGAIEVK